MSSLSPRPGTSRYGMQITLLEPCKAERIENGAAFSSEHFRDFLSHTDHFETVVAVCNHVGIGNARCKVENRKVVESETPYASRRNTQVLVVGSFEPPKGVGQARCPEFDKVLSHHVFRAIGPIRIQVHFLTKVNRFRPGNVLGFLQKKRRELSS